MPLIVGATMQWESADKSIGKIVLKPAVYTKKATEHSMCNVLVDKLDVKGASNKDLIEKYHTDILNSEGEKVLIIGEASAEIDRKIENAIQMMNIHERSLVTITMPAIQSEINSESIIVKFQITLIKCERNKPIWELNAEEKYEIALKYKERGIELFKDLRITDAFYKFSRACKILITLEPIPDLELDKQLESNINNLRLMLYNNMAMCHLNRKNYEHTITLCTKILDKDKNNVKALYRRGVAYGNMKNNEKAVADIKEVLTLEPNNNAAKEKFNIYNDRLQESVQRSNDMIKRMFKTY
ncbi:peptidyl-prolyl cis-trans isomerase FKBP4-like [Cataglyphis hispanica]|uniref:peptidyl-prolyl cis-trans isomerase FKBP4-like n=1 Tax=Cataglyphis hispanica TaxID=1086592 RepID=UPI00218087F3|nr:peptidyl-prolyl cis-trans isomerase FKBP4-like [Cataglyphis hispanica]